MPNLIPMYTDTGTGGNNPGVTQRTGNANTGGNFYSISVKPVSNITAKTTTPTKTSTTTAKTTTPTAAATPTTAATTQTAVAATPAASTPSTPAYNYDNWLSYYNNLVDLANGQYSAQKNIANNYNNQATNNLNVSSDQWNSAYNTNKSAIDQLAAENAQREQAMNQAIDQAYAQLMDNANGYYGQLLDAYNRSMGYVNQGYEEGKSASEKARDEAINLAAQLYAMGEETQNRQTERGLRSQYISYLKGMRNMDQQLAAQGINGGASETALLNALNGYESNRSDMYEANLAALGALRQQQMQSSSEAEQAYLNKLADLISQRTTNQLGVENTRSAGEANYANMKNDAANTRSNQTLQAQQAYQQWASDIANRRNSVENAYAQAVADLANSKNNVAQTYAEQMQNAENQKTANAQSSAMQAAIDAYSASGKSTGNKKVKATSTKKSTKSTSKSSSSKKTTTKSTSSKKTTTTKKTTKKK